MKKILTDNKTLVISLLLILSGSVFAQKPIIKLDSLSKIRIGEQTNLVIELPWDGKTSVNWPVIKDSIGKIEVVKTGKIDSISEGDRKSLKQSITITAFDSGYYKIPPFTFEYPNQKDSALRFVYSDSLFLSVTEVKADTTKAIKDIKEIEQIPLSWEEIYPWILYSLGALALIALIIWLIYKYKRKEPIFKLPAKPKLPAHIVALNELENIRIQRIWQSGKIKEYHTQITDTIRTYIEERFDIYAKEMISDEIKLSIKDKVDDNSFKALGNILETADMVKFAKADPLPSEHDNSLQNAILFVKNTMPQNDNETNIQES